MDGPHNDHDEGGGTGAAGGPEPPVSGQSGGVDVLCMAVESHFMNAETTAPPPTPTPTATTTGPFATAGWNFYGQCLVPTTADDDEVELPVLAGIPELLPDCATIVLVAVGDGHSLLLDSCGQMWTVGANDCGQLGRGRVDEDNDNPDQCILRSVPSVGVERIVLVAAGRCHSAAVSESGKVFAWGDNAQGQCGAGEEYEHVSNVTHCALGALEDTGVCAVNVACGSEHTVIVTRNDASDGVIVFGCNDSGQLGTGNNVGHPIPVALVSAALDGVRLVGCAAGNDFTHLVSDGGSVFATGDNASGQLGIGGTDDVNEPTEISAAYFGHAPVVAVACGGNHMLALTQEHAVYACGSGSFGVTCLGHVSPTSTPQPVTGAMAGARVVRLTAGYEHSFALAEDGRVFGCGRGVGVNGAGAEGSPQLLQGALADSTVRALGVGSNGLHAAFLIGFPPAYPGFEVPTTFVWLQRNLAWRRRRTLLLCLITKTGGLLAKGVPSPAAAATAAAAVSSTDILLRIASLPMDLWKGPCIFKFL